MTAQGFLVILGGRLAVAQQTLYDAGRQSPGVVQVGGYHTYLLNLENSPGQRRHPLAVWPGFIFLRSHSVCRVQSNLNGCSARTTRNKDPLLWITAHS